MLCSPDRMTDRSKTIGGEGRNSVGRKLARQVSLCLIALLVFVAGCGLGTSPGSGQAEVPAESDSGGLASLFGPSTDASGETAAPTSAATLKTGDVVTNSIGMKLGVLPPGSFSMGSPETEEKRSGDESTHAVRLSKPAFMGIYEVTQAEFQSVMESNPSGITGSDRLPVQNISWEQAVAFCRKLSELPEEKSTGRVYRLPTEAEWEYACRAGSTTPTSVGVEITSSQANFDGNYPYGTSTTGTFLGKPQEVGSYEPNAWGLYDLHGNVWEWCSDWYAADYYSNSDAEDPQGPDNGISHVIRGGSWYNFGYVLRSAYRSEFTPPLEANIYGFRVVASLGLNEKFAASELDNPNPTPMTSPSSSPATPAVAASPAMTPPVAAGTAAASSSIASSSSMMESMADSPAMTDSDSAPSEIGAAPVETAATSPSQSTRRTSASPGGSIVRHVILIPAGLLALLMLVDPARLNQPRHYDLLFILLASTLSVMPFPWLQTFGLVALAAAVTIRLIIGLRSASLPKAVVPKLKDGTLLTLTVVAFFVTTILEQAAGVGSTFIESVMSVVAKVAVVTALFVIGKRWKNKTLGLAMAFLWIVLPVGVSSIATALFLWAFVFLQRAPLAGVLFGMAIAANWWLCFLLPLWVSYFRGKARMRFLTVSVTCGIFGLLMLAVLSAVLVPEVTTSGAATTTGASMLLSAICTVSLAVAATATWFWPKVKSETGLTVLSAALLLGVVVSCRTPASLSLVSPWLVLVLAGGSATLGRPIVAEGLVMPTIRRLANSFARVHRSS
jgi:formylglycine-generating enzyme required for sulfatase activity